MKPLLFLLTAMAVACATPALARDKAAGEAARAAAQHRPPSPARLAQQERMRSCNATARSQNLHGAPRKEFMRGCLRKH
ncbi:PsiF family protein [Roseomonas sp. E05]|uniref:PsiF family protein n=1 Tax=Roseomonas sp. E05 TaxID=3046310 RepID=UPI0024B8A20C|nr:PsiF family protein [Roseomonas sp. E05]MDJ0388087.1 PsiF family protein [Roseomonas sp. E05]